MSVGFVAHGVAPRTTLTDESPGARLFNTYITSAGVQTHEGQEWVRLFNDLGAAAVKGRPYMVFYDGDEEENPKAATPATTAADVHTYIVVAMEDVADQHFGWYCFKGYVDAFVDGDATDVAKDDYLKVANTATAFTGDTTTRTAQSCGIACEANTGTAALKKIYLFGEPCDI